MNRLVGLIAFSLLFFSCGQSPKSKYNVELQALQAKADLVNRDFRKIRLEIDVIASQIEELYKNQDSILLSINRSKYEFANNGVFYKPVDDGGSAIFVSGFYPIDKEVQVPRNCSGLLQRQELHQPNLSVFRCAVTV